MTKQKITQIRTSHQPEMIPFFINIKLLVSTTAFVSRRARLRLHLETSNLTFKFGDLFIGFQGVRHMLRFQLFFLGFSVFCFSIFLLVNNLSNLYGFGIEFSWLAQEMNQWTDRKHGKWWIGTDEHAPCNSLSHHITCKFHYCVLWGECLLEVPFVHSFSGGLVSTSRILQDFAGGFVRFFMLDFEQIALHGVEKTSHLPNFPYQQTRCHTTNHTHPIKKTKPRNQQHIESRIALFLFFEFLLNFSDLLLKLCILPWQTFG